MTPFFSIIIPTYNRAEMIGATIESILAQDYPYFEVLVIDDGSTDDTETTVRQYNASKVIYHRIDRGERSTARNHGTRLAKGDYINWFDSDDIMLPGHLEQLKKIIQTENSPPLIGVAYEMEKDGEGIVYREKYPAKQINQFLVSKNYMLTMTGIVRRDIALNYPFNTKINFLEDYELWLRIAAEHPVISSNYVTVRVREHQSNSTLFTRETVRDYIRGIDEFIKEVKGNSKVCRFIDGKMSLFRMNLYIRGAYFLSHCGLKTMPVRLLFRSIRSNPVILLNKGFYATIKQLLFRSRTLK